MSDSISKTEPSELGSTSVSYSINEEYSRDNENHDGNESQNNNVNEEEEAENQIKSTKDAIQQQLKKEPKFRQEFLISDERIDELVEIDRQQATEACGSAVCQCVFLCAVTAGWIVKEELYSKAGWIVLFQRENVALAVALIGFAVVFSLLACMKTYSLTDRRKKF